MSSLSERIKKERENLGLTREEFSKKLGVSYSAIAMYEQGNREPNNDSILKMCELFNCSVDYLMGKSNFKNIYEEISNDIETKGILDVQKLLKNTKKNSISAIPVKQEELFLKDKTPKSFNEKGYMINAYMQQNNITSMYLTPVYGQISAGQPNWAEECLEGYLPIDPNLMNIVDPEECFFLRINGESMNKLIRNGAYALIRKQDVVENGEIAVVLVNGYDATLKKFTRQNDLIILEPMSNDPNFTTQVYAKDTEIKILGKYIGKFEMNS